MAKIKDSREAMEAIKEGAALKGATDKKERGTLINRMVYKIPPEIVNALDEHGLKFSSFAVMAVREKLLRDGYMSQNS